MPTTLKAETLRALAEKATQEDDDARYYGGPPSKHLPHGSALDVYLRNAVPEILELLAGKDERVAALEVENVRMREALEGARTHHEDEHKALSKQPPNNEHHWRKMQHREQIDEIARALGEERP